MNNQKKRIFEVIKQSLPLNMQFEVNPNGLLNHIDSLSIINCIIALEEEFSLEIDDEFLIYDNFLSIDKIDCIINGSISKLVGNHLSRQSLSVTYE